MSSGEAAAQDTAREVWELLDGDETIDEQAAYLVAAALEGDAELHTQAGAGAHRARPGAPADEPPEPAVAFLRSITVSGFRGIGPAAVLEVHPRPGITVVSGRNGSGKSSFAEALEYALTGTSYRWAEKSKHWRGAWRNLHVGTASIAVDFALQRAGTGGAVTIGAKWTDGADLEDAHRWSQVTAEKQTEVRALGWDHPLAVHRPLLSYDELGGVFDDNPSALYDSLNRMLGLDAVADAEARLKALIKESEGPRKAADSARSQLRITLAACEDSRAAEVAKKVARKPYDLDAITTVTHGSGTPQAAAVAALRRLGAIQMPDPAPVIAELRAALAESADAAVAAVHAAERRNALLRDAVALHSETGDGPCPVCESGTLDGDWRARVSAELDRTDAELAGQRSAQQGLAAAESAARSLVAGLPHCEPVPGLSITEVDDWNAAVLAARGLPASSVDWPTHLELTIGAVDGAGELLRVCSLELAAALEDAWAPVSQEVGTWVRLEQGARPHDAKLAAAKTALDWLKANSGTLRARRLAPIVGQARDIWGRLRQESNVELDEIALEGTTTRRRVELRGTVDGEPVGALSVMSQGELHALALALFIPRATAAASPFRFLVLDDPIQAMDPAKITGFLEVLQALAVDRQVIVFSHDDRLAKAIRNASIPAQLVEVVREAGSRVVAKEADTPAHRYIRDAEAVIRDEGLNESVKRKAVPGLFRMAVEAAAGQRFYSDRSRAGDQYDHSERRWETALTTQQKVALTLTGDVRGNIGGWKAHRQWRGPTITICARGVHAGVDDLRGALDDLRRTVDDLLAGR